MAYFESVGRRKTAVARVRMEPSAKTTYEVNGLELAEYFPTAELQHVVNSPFGAVAIAQKFAVTALINGSGIHSQAEALRHGIARALIIYDKELRTTVKKPGYLKRDPRSKERREFGLKKARKAPQWSKR